MGIPCSSKTVRMTLCSGSSLKAPVSEWEGRGDWASQSGTGNGLSCQPVAPLHVSHEEIKEAPMWRLMVRDHTTGKSSTGSDAWLRASGIPTPSLHVKVDPPRPRSGVHNGSLGAEPQPGYLGKSGPWRSQRDRVKGCRRQRVRTSFRGPQ